MPRAASPEAVPRDAEREIAVRGRRRSAKDQAPWFDRADESRLADWLEGAYIDRSIHDGAGPDDTVVSSPSTAQTSREPDAPWPI